MGTVIRATFLALSLACSGLPAFAGDDWIDAALGDRWRGTRTADPITDAPLLRLYLITTEVNGAVFGRDMARVMLTCAAGKSSLDFEWTIKAASKTNLVVAYRFEGQPGRTVKARYVNNSEQETTQLGDVRQFVRDAGLSQRLYLQVNSDRFGVNEARFKAKAGPSATASFVEACPDAGPR
jgi:hypothetical protein